MKLSEKIKNDIRRNKGIINSEVLIEDQGIFFERIDCLSKYLNEIETLENKIEILNNLLEIDEYKKEKEELVNALIKEVKAHINTMDSKTSCIIEEDYVTNCKSIMVIEKYKNKSWKEILNEQQKY